MSRLTAEIAREFLDYNPETGKLFWKTRDQRWFASAKRDASHNASAWNKRFAGEEAFTNLEGGGYLRGRILGRYYKAHRVIWLIHSGYWPTDEIDHINGVRTDNRLINLRPVTSQQNKRNASRRSDNTSGTVGVNWQKQRAKWRAEITISGRTKHLGLFSDYESAAAARKSAEQEYGFHKNHGRT